MHHGLAVGADWQIDLDAVAGRDRRAHGTSSVLDHAPSCVMQPAMGDGPRNQPVQRSPHRQDTSTRPSTSTAASAGNAATPTVERACLPLSPKAATMTSEAPFITFGPSTKPAAELMKPPSRTTRATLSRSPIAALTCASRLIAQARAAF